MGWTEIRSRGRSLGLAFVCFGVFLLTGCVTTPQPVSVGPSPWLDSSFSVSGKIALRYPRCSQYHACREEAVSARMSWTHRKESDQVVLYDPFGQEIVTLFYHGGMVSLSDRDGTHTLSRQELGARLGFTVPINDIRKWAFVPGETGDFSSNGWHVNQSGWQTQGYYRKLTLTRKDHYLRILIMTIRKVM